jgi:hypothetical protein
MTDKQTPKTTVLQRAIAAEEAAAAAAAQAPTTETKPAPKGKGKQTDKTE